MFPIHLNLGFTVIHFYEGFYFLIAILTGYFLSQKRLGKIEFNNPDLNNMVFFSLICALIGTRLSHFLFWNIDILIDNPLVLVTQPGGASIIGGLYSGILAAFIYSKIKKIDFYRFFATISPCILLAQALGRIGCFLNGDAHGIQTNLPWGVKFPRFGFLVPDFRMDTSAVHSSYAWRWSFDNGLVSAKTLSSAPLHPTQMYESLLDILLMALIIFITKILDKKNRSLKPVLYLHVGGYAFFRFWLEFIRADRTQVLGFISVLQIFLLGGSTAVLVLFIRHATRSKEKKT